MILTSTTKSFISRNERKTFGGPIINTDTLNGEGEGNVFTGVCPFTPGRIPHPSRRGGHPSFLMGGNPFLGLDGVPPSQVWQGCTPIQDQDGGGGSLGLDGVPPQTRPGKGVPHPDMGRGTPIQVRSQAGGYPNQNNIACTCYAAVVCLLRLRRRTFLVPKT